MIYKDKDAFSKTKMHFQRQRRPKDVPKTEALREDIKDASPESQCHIMMCNFSTTTGTVTTKKTTRTSTTTTTATTVTTTTTTTTTKPATIMMTTTKSWDSDQERDHGVTRPL
jgi:hypothetical protein